VSRSITADGLGWVAISVLTSHVAAVKAGSSSQTLAGTDVAVREHVDGR
jgi:hypothetical protein